MIMVRLGGCELERERERGGNVWVDVWRNALARARCSEIQRV